MTTTLSENLYEQLTGHGLVSQCTDDQLAERLSRPVTAYIGFDPTADSLHVGSLVPIMGLAHLQRCGHKPIVLIGGATALVGDPSGKTEARKMLSREQVNENAGCIAKQISRVVRFDDSPTGAVMVNNADWLAGMNWIDMLREVGRHFSVNRMITMESVKGRMEGDGISFLEFNYMIMQAYDFLYLYRQHHCTLQMGGQDQWGNIVMGIDLVRRIENASLAGLTFPLVTRSDGGKFGKTESGNVWLDPNRSSPYEFYQFWRNVADCDVGKYLGYFTFLPVETIRQLGDRSGRELNESKEILAYEVTKLIHGQDQADQARDSAKKAFGAGRDVTGDAIPSGAIERAELETGVTLITLLVRAGLCQSNGEARRLITGGGVKLADQQIVKIDRIVTTSDITNNYVLIRAGKKRLFRFDVTG